MKKKIKTDLLILALFCNTLFSYSQSQYVFPAEFEAQYGVVLTWDYNSQVDSTVARILSAVQDHAKSFLIYYPGTVPYDTSYIKSYISSFGVQPGEVTLVPAWTETLWIRDYGPLSCYAQYGNSFELTFLDAGYSSYNRPKDDSVPAQLANQWNYYSRHLPLELEGGNILTDGLGRGVGSKRIWDQNPLLSSQQIEDTLKKYLGLTEFLFLDKLEHSGGGIWMHVDMYMKFLDNETVLLSEYPSYLPDYGLIESVAAMFAGLTNKFGRHYRVVRIPAPPRSDGTYATSLNGEMRTYTNSLIVNDMVVLPVYNHPYDTVAKQIYEKSLPGYTVIPVDARTLTPNYGAIHCITDHVGHKSYLRILHPKITGGQAFTPDISFYCETESNLIPDSILLYYRILPDTSFVSYPMYPSCPGNTVTLTNFQITDTVEYFIRAVSSGFAAKVPLTAPEHPYTFWFDPVTRIDDMTGNVGSSKVTVWPNPNNGVFRVTVLGMECPEKIVVMDLEGKIRYIHPFHPDLVNDRLSEGKYLPDGRVENHPIDNVTTGNVCFDKTFSITDLDNGLYLIVVNFHDEAEVKKLIICR